MVASKLFNPEDRKAVSAAVAEAEKKTSAEIVPVVATTSDAYERAEDGVGLAMAAVAVTAAWTQFHRLPTDWDTESSTIQLPFVLAAMLGGWVVGVLLARASPWLKRLAISRKKMTVRVLIAAKHAFDSLHAHKTAGGTGVVVYVSLFEHRVCIWADKHISAKISEAEWKGITETLIKALRDGHAKDGLVDAIRRCGDLLAKDFPVKPGDVNELPNELRLLD
jgi:putative membrane protein